VNRWKGDGIEAVARCVATQDGTWLVITKTGKTASSPTELAEGARVSIRANGSCAPRGVR
jgi:hypothetical protein